MYAANGPGASLPSKREGEVEPYERVQRREHRSKEGELQEEELPVAQACNTLAQSGGKMFIQCRHHARRLKECHARFSQGQAKNKAWK